MSKKKGVYKNILKVRKTIILWSHISFHGWFASQFMEYHNHGKVSRVRKKRGRKTIFTEQTLVDYVFMHMLSYNLLINFWVFAITLYRRQSRCSERFKAKTSNRSFCNDIHFYKPILSKMVATGLMCLLNTWHVAITSEEANSKF